MDVTATHLKALERCTSRWRSPGKSDLKNARSAINELKPETMTPAEQLKLWKLLPLVQKHLSALGAKIDQLNDSIKKNLNFVKADDASETVNSVYQQIITSDAETRKIARTFYRAILGTDYRVLANPRSNDLRASIRSQNLVEVEMMLLEGVAPKQLFQDPFSAALSAILSCTTDAAKNKAWEIIEALVHAGSDLNAGSYTSALFSPYGNELSVLDMAVLCS